MQGARRRFALRLVRFVLLLVLVTMLASVGAGQSRGVQAVGSTTDVYLGLYGGYETPPLVQRAAGLGVRAMRVPIEWAELEFTRGYHLPDTFVFTQALAQYDTRIRSLSDAGVKPIVLVHQAPTWAAARARGPLNPGENGTFANFMRKLVLRWSQPPFNVKHWELWAEPDAGDTLPPGTPNFFANRLAWGDHPAQFADMLRAAYPAIKAADANATVIVGALAYDYFRSSDGPGFNGGGPFVYPFIENVLAQGGGCCFDWLGFNTYPPFAVGWEAANPGAGYDVMAKAAHIRARMAAYSIAKPLVVMEGGLSSCCPPSGGFNFYRRPDGSIGDYVPSERDQAAYLARLYAWGLAADLKGVFWYLFTDGEPANVFTSPELHRGWFHQDMSAKAAARAFQLFSSRLSAATFAGTFTGVLVESGRVEAYWFTRPNGSPLIMLMSPYGPTETAVAQIAGSGQIVYNAHGENVPTERVGGNIRFTVGFAPVFVESFADLGYRSVIPAAPRANPGG